MILFSFLASAGYGRFLRHSNPSASILERKLAGLAIILHLKSRPFRTWACYKTALRTIQNWGKVQLCLVPDENILILIFFVFFFYFGRRASWGQANLFLLSLPTLDFRGIQTCIEGNCILSSADAPIRLSKQRTWHEAPCKIEHQSPLLGDRIVGCNPLWRRPIYCTCSQLPSLSGTCYKRLISMDTLQPR